VSAWAFYSAYLSDNNARRRSFVTVADTLWSVHINVDPIKRKQSPNIQQQE